MFTRRIHIHGRLTKQELSGYMTAVYKYLKEINTALGEVLFIMNVREAKQTRDK